jgi:Papain fold toxin 1, glutamine deamidase
MTQSITVPRPDQVLTGPAWARAAAAAVLGDGWPTGDEAATWDVADRWYALADALTGPRMSAFAAADQIVAGLVGAGIAPDGFREAWERLTGDDDAPLNALVQIAAELGQMVEECGREIEAAKLAASVEVGTVLTELAGLSIAIELTLGAAGLAAAGLITAGRAAVEQIYGRLASSLAGEQVTRPQAADPAHYARSDQRTIRLTAPNANTPDTTVTPTPHPAGVQTSNTSGARTKNTAGAPTLGGAGARTSGIAGAMDSAVGTTSGMTPTTADTATLGSAVHATNRRALAEAAGETRRLSPAQLRPPVRGGNAEVSTRRLAPRPRDGRRDLGDETRRLVAPPASRPAFGRPTIPLQRTAGSHGHAADLVRHDEYADFLAGLADEIRAGLAIVGGDRALAAYADEVEAQAAVVGSRPAPLPAAAPEWARDDREPERSAEAQTPGGLRRPPAVHQQALQDAVPAADRRPDPRVGRWFSLLNAGGPSDDPTRGVNCLDAVLALFETYQRGRPRVAGARTFDGYAHGAPERPIGGEWAGVRRIQRAARSEFQNLCPFVGGASPEQASSAVDAAFRNLANHLHNSGHGAFAFILTDFAPGGCHAWAAVNQDATILFLDPQLGLVSPEEPLYRDVVSMDALVVDGAGDPAPLPYHGIGQWTAV